MNKLRIIFKGTPRFALPSLQILIDRSEQIAAVVTQPDRPAGRGQHIALPPIKELALKHNLPVLQPVKVRDAQFIAQIKELSPDLIVVVAFGRLSAQGVHPAEYGLSRARAARYIPSALRCGGSFGT